MTKEELDSFQKRHLNKIIRYAADHSEYYKGILEYEDLPIIDKNTMMEYFDRINTVGLKRDELLAFSQEQANNDSIDLYQGKYSVGMSSGTSGNKGLTVLGQDERDNYTAVLFTRKGFPPGVKGKRILFALRRNNPSFMEVGKFGIKIIYTDYTVHPREIIKIVNEKQLSVIAGPPSLLKEIGKYREFLTSQIECLVSYAEVLSYDMKQFLIDQFNAPVVQIYQGSEGFIGSTCRDGYLHINEDLVYLEIKKLNDEVGRVIVTDLFRTTQPILRYALNDILELDETPCSCGSVFRKIRHIHGRADDIFLLHGNDLEEKLLFPDYVRRSIISASDAITEYQAIQKDYKTIEIRINDVDHLDNVKYQICRNIEKYVKKINASMPEIIFSTEKPEKNPRSQKLIRIRRDF
ncbi:MAG: hypothetical protein INQ03_02165 [Candidatus Heimdallarchaeota archaeon]|nr:hypothetical protein [Candidatus Heimdallarchaeota archaeon]